MTEETDRERHAGNRLDAFVDAAFAFAVTLLVIATAEPPRNLPDLWAAMGRIPASAAAFALIALFWVGHKAFGRLALRRDAITQLISLAIVFTVLAYVYPLRLLTEAAFFWMSGGRLPGQGMIKSWGDLQTLYVVYGIGFAGLAGLYAALFGHAVRKAAAFRLRGAALEEMRDFAAIWLILLGAGVLSALFAAVGPLRQAPWLPGFTYCAIPLAIGLRSWLKQRANRRPAKR